MRLYAALFAIGLVVYGLFAGSRIARPSDARQYVLQADAWLHGKASVDPPFTDADYAKLETAVLDDGTTVQGRRMLTRPMFHVLGDGEIPIARVKQSQGFTWYVSFPPLPSVLMLPSALIAGRDGNDVVPTLVIAALILPLTLLVLRRLAAAGLSARSVRDDLWLVGMFAFGSVLFFSSVQGKVWYTAQVVGVALALIYAWAAIEAKRPLVAGLAIAAAALTRPPMMFMFPLFVFEAWRHSGGDRQALLRALIRFAAPIIGFAIIGMTYNYVRFGSPTEFGHAYLDVRQQGLVEQFGLASYHYLERNLTVAFTLLPELIARPPWIQIGGHGLAIWVTTPFVLATLWPRTKPRLHRVLWITIACVAAPSLLYMNSGWVQFGYRFSLDYMVLVVMLLAIGGVPLGRVAKALIIVGVVVNVFGAYTFDRDWRFYRTGGNAYDVVVPN